jgi:hypothetical protein
MAKHADPANELIYQAAQTWIDTCLEADGSLFSPGAEVWTADNLQELFDRIWVHGDATPGSGYVEKLKRQLDDATDAQVQLAAEVNAVHFLSVWPGAITGKTKRKLVDQILSWMPSAGAEVPQHISEAFDVGLAHPGRYALQRRDTQVACILHVSLRWKGESAEVRAALRSDPWKFQAWLLTGEEPKWENQRQMLLHLFHPGVFEPIVSLDHTRQIVERFSSLAGSDSNLDRQLLAIRSALSPTEGTGFNWYDEPRQHRWLKDRTKWKALCKWAERFRALPEFEESERLYKLKAVERIGRAREIVLARGSGWFEELKPGFQNQNNNITNWQAHDTFLKWVSSNRESAASALLALWSGDASASQRVRDFLDRIPQEAISTPGNRLTIASYLLMAEDPAHHPPYKPSAIKAAWAFAGWKIPPIEPEEVVYETFLTLCDELVHSCPSLQDRLDAQGALWALTKWDHAEKPASWTDADWTEFLAFLGAQEGVGEGPAQGGDAISSDDDLIAEAAAELHLDRSVLDHIVDLLEDKRQVILYGPPGTGKTYLAKTLARALGKLDPARSTVVQFHPATSYEDFIQGLRPETTDAGQVTYRLRDGHLMVMANRATADPDHQHVMVIDEINRANLPKVLGELLFLLEYRDDEVPLLYEPERPFSLPKNLWFIGTMNTADRSIALIDAALRRRFHFVPFFPTQPPIDGLLDRFLADNGFSPAPAAFLRAVNTALLTKQGIDEHVLVGPSHFMNERHYVDGVMSEEILERIWTYNIFPLIEELLWGQAAEIEAWRWTKVCSRFDAQLGVSSPPEEFGADGPASEGEGDALHETPS